jgi:hypothetical protein
MFKVRGERCFKFYGIALIGSKVPPATLPATINASLPAALKEAEQTVQEQKASLDEAAAATRMKNQKQGISPTTLAARAAAYRSTGLSP